MSQATRDDDYTGVLELCSEGECGRFAILGLGDESCEHGYRPLCLDHFEESLDSVLDVAKKSRWRK